MMNKKKKVLVVIFIIHHSAFSILFAGCGARRTPNLARIFESARERRGKRPLIVIPGMLGSQIVNRRTGEVVWPSVFRSDVDGLSLPTTPDLPANGDALGAAKIVDVAKLAKVAPEGDVCHYLLRGVAGVGRCGGGD